MADERDLERVVKIAAPYDASVESEVLVESLPVWFDLGWQKVDGEDYGPYADVTPADPDTNPSYEYRANATNATPPTPPRGSVTGPTSTNVPTTPNS